MAILMLKISMTIISFVMLLGHSQARHNNLNHRRLMMAAFGLTLVVFPVFLIAVYGFDVTYKPAAWLTRVLGSPEEGWKFLTAHRVVSSVTFLVMCVQVATGVLRHPLHKRLHWVVVVLWSITYISGIVLFG